MVLFFLYGPSYLQKTLYYRVCPVMFPQAVMCRIHFFMINQQIIFQIYFSYLMRFFCWVLQFSYPLDLQQQRHWFLICHENMAIPFHPISLQIHINFMASTQLVCISYIKSSIVKLGVLPTAASHISLVLCRIEQLLS